MDTLKGHEKDLGGGFVVRRLLPAATHRSVGPWVFFDHFGPVEIQPSDQHDVRPHPHIGLATVSYLFDGAIHHRDSLGSDQTIEPGAVNWMTAGSGITHSERRPARLAGQRYVNHGLQLWLALPRSHEEVAPTFVHTPASDVPQVQIGAHTIRVLIGSALGQRSPVQTYAPTLYLDVALAAGEPLQLKLPEAQLAVYPVLGDDVQVNGAALAAHTMAVPPESASGHNLSLSSAQGARIAIIGGEPLDGPRFMWWNFVSSRKERIDQAAEDWTARRFAPVPGETEFIPAPMRPQHD
jgi:redox-sensitive bicupin YhaK (pirin superfamily)